MNQINIKEKSEELIRILKFALVGGSNTLINWITFIILNFIGVNYIIANIIAYCIATINSYIFNSLWVFKNKSDRIKTSIKFIILNCFGLIINTFLLYCLVDIFKIDKFIALLIVTFIVMIINYIINKLWVFRR